MFTVRPDPAQRSRLEEIRKNLEDRITEAKFEGWLGEVEGLQVSLAGAKDKLAQIDNPLDGLAAVDLGTPPCNEFATTMNGPSTITAKFREACLSCGHFATDATHADELRDQHARTTAPWRPSPMTHLNPSTTRPASSPPCGAA